MKLDLQPHHKYLLKKSVLKCGIVTPLIGGIINALLYKPGRTVAYLGVEVFVGTFTTAFICNLIYCWIFNEEHARKCPKMPYNLDTHVLYKYFPKDSYVKQSAFLGIVTALIISTLPALMLMLTGLNSEATFIEWVGCKMLTGIAYSSFSAYHIIAYRATAYQREHSAAAADRQDVVDINK